MKKPGQLRAALEAALGKHDLAQNPDRLFMVATDWRPVADGRPGRGLQLAYTLELTFLDFAGDPIEITIPLMLWLARWQHDVFASADAAGKAINGTFELLQHGKYDASIKLQLTETVRFEPAAGGGYDVTYIEEPMPMAFEDGPPLHALFLNGDQLFHCTAHPDQGL